MGLVLGSRMGLVLGSRMELVLGSRMGLVLGSRMGLVLGSRMGLVLGSWGQEWGWFWGQEWGWFWGSWGQEWGWFWGHGAKNGADSGVMGSRMGTQICGSASFQMHVFLLQLDTSELQTIGSPQGRGESGDRRLHGTGEERGLSDLGRMLQGVCGQLERLQHQVQALYERVDRLANPAGPAPERAEVCGVCVCVCVRACVRA